ncbi:AzlD domain-containing protein [Sporomusa malonica]|uniref:Branched-chain amino acid transport protein n=1 Tax=Sporomusa malonica TaxID=112901 RepID=A0A1W2CY35_9FIRM|nr:AzlD domain-containing protein [Sporomusa malonica]SMC89804.1 Branched-chain amino acid transport protein [Sporomusa malonica]
MTSYLPLIIAMMIVTYLPRLLPWVVLSERPLHPLLRRFLLYIPYTALGALIVRGVLEAPSEMTLATLAGIAVSAACSWYKGGMVSSVSASIIAVFLILSYQ